LSLSRWVLRGLTLVAVLALMLALVAACKSSKKSDDGGGKTPAAEQSPSSNETPDGDGDGEGLQDLKRLASEAAGGAKGKVTYEYSFEGGGQSAQAEWTLVQRPPDDTRYEIATTEGGEESRTIVIQTVANSYLCTLAGGAGTCFESDQTASYTSGFAPLFDIPQQLVTDINDIGVTDKSERKIGGVRANCFSVDTTAFGGGASEVCFSDEGMMLLLKGQAGGTSFTFEATSATTDVSDADFEPPYEVLELPG